MDDHQCGYLTKLERKNLAHTSFLTPPMNFQFAKKKMIQFED
jgi:hypothetical protein